MGGGVLSNSSEHSVRVAGGCELLRVRAARVVTLNDMLCGAACLFFATCCAGRHADFNFISVLRVRPTVPPVHDHFDLSSLLFNSRRVSVKNLRSKLKFQVVLKFSSMSNINF